MCVQIIELMSEGRSKRASCSLLGIHEDTLYEWAKVHSEFSEALKTAELACAEWWEDKGRDAMQGQIVGFNATAFVWMTKNVLKWSDRQQLLGDDEKPLAITIVRHGEEE